MSTVVKNTNSPLGVMILTWLLTHADGGTPNEIEKALQVIVGQRWTAAERRRALEEEMASLEQEGKIERCRRSARVLTKSGNQAALTALGAESEPADTTWQSVKKLYLFARALDVPPPATLPTPQARSAAVLSRHHRLGIGAEPTLTQVKHALAWRAIGGEPGKPFTAEAAMAVLLNRMLGTKKAVPVNEALGRLAAKAAGASRAGAEEIEKSILSRWIQGVEVVPAVASQEHAASAALVAPPEKVTPRLALPAGDDAFALRAVAAARASKTGRFGDNKVFISHVLRQLASEGFAVDDTDAVKARLVAAHQSGFLSLSRADLVEAMAPEDVDTSETRYRRATFHFVRI